MSLESNLKKCLELVEHAQIPAICWLRDCNDLGMMINVTEAYRSQERQNALYKIGRRGIKGERPVTWSLRSKHTSREAMDIDIIGSKTTYEDIEESGRQYGIYRPKDLVKLGDLRHFQCEKAKMPVRTMKASLRRAQRLAKASPEPRRGRILDRIKSVDS